MVGDMKDVEGRIDVIAWYDSGKLERVGVRGKPAAILGGKVGRGEFMLSGPHLEMGGKGVWGRRSIWNIVRDRLLHRGLRGSKNRLWVVA